MNREENYIGYEYKEITIKTKNASFYLDCYESFGWKLDDNLSIKENQDNTILCLKRNRKIINKMELTRLQNNFEACAQEIKQLENSKTNSATAISLIIGMIGTIFMAGSTFAIVHEPPIIWLCILLAIPGFMGWIVPYFLYKTIVQKKSKEIQKHIDAKYDEIYEICKKGYSLL
ncbi:hypothetical protein [Floccifex sp.]|uniref:hypothetical protein n=1 Tax=Floccifex sp. TaxID=2815810 RepID=UPI003F03C8E3